MDHGLSGDTSIVFIPPVGEELQAFEVEIVHLFGVRTRVENRIPMYGLHLGM